ncbi:MAG: SurA N-terminal domain-containing protein [Alphaproteobacteria bacterium]|nr:SurA N-terminal domain-containing protein [Alphaproteobacteria bacterium]
MKKLLIALCAIHFAFNANAATVVATVDGIPITDKDITARIRLMELQGQRSTDNRIRALSNIIDDSIKISYAESIKISPSESDIKNEVGALKERGFDTSGLDKTGMEVLRSALRANIAWQMVIGRTIMPTIDVAEEDIESEILELGRARGLPIEITLIRLVGIPAATAARLSTPSDCAAAEKMARDLGGAPQKITAPEYELSEEIRIRISGQPILTWGSRENDSVLLICERKKMNEYGNLDEIIKQNAIWKRAMFVGDQQLKQLRRRAVIIINDAKYRGAIS